MKIEYVIIDEKLKYDDVKKYLFLLPEQRREKIARYRFDSDKLLSFAAGLLIRRAIGDSVILSHEHGKPYTEGDKFFSVSHSGRIAAIAVDDAEIGLDVERIPDETRLRIADRFYHPAERAFVAGACDQRRAFCEIWTRKEAYLKMTGEGISTDLTAFDTTESPLRELLFSTALEDYCLSVCCETPIGERNINISKLELNELLQAPITLPRPER